MNQNVGFAQVHESMIEDGNPSVETSTLERQIDELVFNLYSLSEEISEVIEDYGGLLIG